MLVQWVNTDCKEKLQYFLKKKQNNNIFSAQDYEAAKQVVNWMNKYTVCVKETL